MRGRKTEDGNRGVGGKPCRDFALYFLNGVFLEHGANKERPRLLTVGIFLVGGGAFFSGAIMGMRAQTSVLAPDRRVARSGGAPT